MSLTLLAGQPGGSGSADGIGGAARFYYPTGLAWDGDRHVYVADSINDAIRRVDLESGVVETVAGQPGAPGAKDGGRERSRLHHPSGLAWDGAGQLFIADTSNASVRRWDAETGKLTTLALRDVPLRAPSGLAFAGGQLFVADEQAAAVWSVEVSSGKGILVAGQPGKPGEVDGAAAVGKLQGPEALAAAAGQLYVADAGGRALRRVELASGRLETIVGSASKLGQPRGLALDPLGHLFVADALDETLRRVDLVTKGVSLLAGGPGLPGGADGEAGRARFSGPVALAYAGPRRLVVADAYTVRMVDPVTGLTRTLAGRTSQPGSADGRGPAATFRRPRGLAFDALGRLYVADSANSAIRRIDMFNGDVQLLAGAPGHPGSLDGSGTAARFGRPLGVVADAEALYVADPWEHDIRRIDLKTSTVTTLAGGGTGGSVDGVGAAARFCGPVALALDGAGHLFAADHPYQDENAEQGEDDDGDERLEALLGRERAGCSSIRRIDLATRAVTTFAGSGEHEGESDRAARSARFNGPMGLACDGRALYVADRDGATVRAIELASGEVRTVAGKAGSKGGADGVGDEARFAAPEGLALDGSGGLLVTDGGGGTLRRIELATRNVSTVLGRYAQTGLALGAAARLNDPVGMAFFGGRLVLSDGAENALLEAVAGP